LCFTADPAAVEGVPDITAIGRVVEGNDLTCRRDGEIVEIDDSGYRHFT
jgi:thiamine monophosphate kinase